MLTYNLYLDESETFIQNTDLRSFAIAGVVIQEEYHDTKVTTELNALKTSLWHDLSNPHDFILHEKDIRYANNKCNKHNLGKVASEYHRFKSNSDMSMLFKGLDKIIDDKNLFVIGASINQKLLYQSYDEKALPDRSFITLQIILENFCHFLNKNNARGKIIYESIGTVADRDMRMRYYQVKAMGSIYINPHSMQERLIGIEFHKKSENLAGLQIADFIPNDIVRSVLGKKPHTHNVSGAIKKQRYNGGIKRKDKFGIKILP